MKRKLSIISILTLLVSCTSGIDKATEKRDQTELIDSLANPDEFIGKYQSKVMILGLFHFDNPGLDDYKEKYEFNILEHERQQQLDIVLKKLAEFKPTKILLEFPRLKGDSIMNSQYLKYLSGEFSISQEKNEWYQIGFKLAKKLNHKKVYPIDAHSKWFGAEIDWDNYNSVDYQKSLGQFEKANRYDYERIYELEDSLKTVQPLIDHLIMINNPKNRLKDHQAYLTNTVLTGAGDLYNGADNVARWYQRNIKIFANAYDLADFNEQDRLMLIFGSGHVWQLRQLFMDSPDFDYVEVNDYLNE